MEPFVTTHHHHHQQQQQQQRESTITTTTTADAIDSNDVAVIGTADDAIFAKLATVQAKYYHDPFLEFFLPRRNPPTRQSKQPKQHLQQHTPHPRPRRQTQQHTQPIIKRGTHARVCCMDRAILAALESVIVMSTNSIKNEYNDATARSEKFDQVPPPQQQRLRVVCLGAGRDTSFFRYRAGLLIGQESSVASMRTSTTKIDWYEVDHPVVIQEKIQMIEQCSLLSAELRVQPEGAHSFRLVDAQGNVQCHLIGHDLRNPPSELVKHLERTIICNDKTSSRSSSSNNENSVSAPVLFTMECVQMYLPDQASRNLWSALGNAFSNSCLCIYDAIIGNDPFGNMMEQNLLDAGVVVLDQGGDDVGSSSNNSSSLLQTRTLTDQMTKLLDCGWNRVVGCDMWNAYQSVITMEQRRQANRCEFLDEVEEWMLIMKHYGIVVATNTNKPNVNTDVAGSGNWGAYFCQVGLESPMGFQSSLCHEMTASDVPSS